jgi:superfamily II DNA helicase RecQ
MQNYIDTIQSLVKPSFEKIRKIAVDCIVRLSQDQKDNLFRELDRGIALLNSHEQMCQYLYSFGKMHQAKLLDAFGQLPTNLFSGDYDIVDWGCGQGMGTMNLFDHIESRGLVNRVKSITLIEPSSTALERALIHVGSYLKNTDILKGIPEYFDNIRPRDVTSGQGNPVIHIFSNILDVGKIDLKKLAVLVDQSITSETFMVCVGPLNPNNLRIDAFYNYFETPLIYNREEYQLNGTDWTYKCKIYKLQVKGDGNLIPIEFYPSVQFHAAYELDRYRFSRKGIDNNFFDDFSLFECAAPFDIGASIYEDVHPILAVLNNIITRGLPTKASIFIEEVFLSKMPNVRKEVTLGEIAYPAVEKLDFEQISRYVRTALKNQKSVEDENGEIQGLLSPIAIARFHKILIEAIITGHLDIKRKEWSILVEEKDVPFAAIAIKDFQDVFHHLTSISEAYDNYSLPEICLDIVSNKTFFQSPLHLDAKVVEDPVAYHFNKKYDLVVDMAVLAYLEETSDSFSRYKCANNCYFKLRSIHSKKKNRNLYTSSLIGYKKLVEKSSRGEYFEVGETKSHLAYFLQLIFRKDTFRPGQLPILDRALQNHPVIGLLPTGGGKSLTYQIAALLQPGITLVIDPLRSLMKDQYDGLIRNGIDCCTFINSSVTVQERSLRERQMESSQMLFVFVSPERLSILNFRERLKQMHEYNVYFSYGVIDEVHCVSEWGHDFRFSYLHLGRNLYNYVRAKDGEISLFGLTATASFDVLADVERELSANGAFALDSDTIVRYENTNRLELQYKIENVPVEFGEDNYFDSKKLLAPGLPKAVNVGNNWPVFDSKSDFLQNYVKSIPSFLNELQAEENISMIKQRFAERQNNEDNLSNDLSVDMPDMFYEHSELYQQAGIVFCPHVKSTGISVEHSARKLSGISPAVGSFSGKDEDNTSMENLERFRDDKQALMVATKAFGMGIDKPNVRFTINMNYSSSLESFVQEAGRAGRDRKMALSVVLMSDYKLSRISQTYSAVEFPLQIIRNKWFKSGDLEKIISHYQLQVPEEHIEVATPTHDMVKLHCSKDNKMFAFNECSPSCTAFRSCKLREVPAAHKGWHTEDELSLRLTELGIPIHKKHFQYLSADYQTVMFFFNSSFKGDVVEKTFMHGLLSTSELHASYIKQGVPIVREIVKGFLSTLVDAQEEKDIIFFVPYTAENSTDISKAIYRMCCIELIEDFTQDYQHNEYRILVRKRDPGMYYEGLERFLLRYYTADRAVFELNKAKNHELKTVSEHAIISEIHRCLAYLTEFVYDKISEKRKRAINDMRNFCLEGTMLGKSWIERNEDLKDYIYYYFNSKYAKTDYVADNGEPFSLTEDTESGKHSGTEILFKYLRVIDDEIVGVGTPIDNAKHLQGAVRLIRRSLTDSNPSLSLLNAFTLCYLGTKENKSLIEEQLSDYQEGMEQLAERMLYRSDFWQIFELYNKKVEIYFKPAEFKKMVGDIKIMIHGSRLNQITEKYITADE